MAVGQLEDPEVCVGRRIARVEAQSRPKSVARRIDITLRCLNGACQVLRRRKPWIRGDRQLNRSRGGSEILVEKLSGGRVVMRPAAVWKETPKRVGNGVQVCSVTRVRVQRRDLLECGGIRRVNGDRFFCRGNGPIERAARGLQFESAIHTPTACRSRAADSRRVMASVSRWAAIAARTIPSGASGSVGSSSNAFAYS